MRVGSSSRVEWNSRFEWADPRHLTSDQQPDTNIYTGAMFWQFCAFCVKSGSRMYINWGHQRMDSIWAAWFIVYLFANLRIHFPGDR